MSRQRHSKSPKKPALVLPGPKVGVKGRFKVELIKGKTGEVKKKLEFENLVVDAGLDTWFQALSLDSLTQYCYVGTGNTPPAETDTDLEARIASTGTSNGYGSYVFRDGEYLLEQNFVATFGYTAANANLTEVGLGNGSAASTLWSRALFRDEAGNPTVITKTDEDQLRVTYTVTMYPLWPASSQVININGTDYTFETIQYDIDSGYNSNFVLFRNTSPRITIYNESGLPADPITPYYGGLSTTGASIAPDAYVAGNQYLDFQVEASPSVANWPEGIGRIAWAPASSSFNPRFEFWMLTAITPNIPKTDLERFRVTLRLMWDRVV